MPNDGIYALKIIMFMSKKGTVHCEALRCLARYTYVYCVSSFFIYTESSNCLFKLTILKVSIVSSNEYYALLGEK